MKVQTDLSDFGRGDISPSIKRRFTDRIITIIENMQFFCKLANLQEFKYHVGSFKTLQKSVKGIIFPTIGYYPTFYRKLTYQIKRCKRIE